MAGQLARERTVRWRRAALAGHRSKWPRKLIRPDARTVAFAVEVSFYFVGLNTMALTTVDRESAPVTAAAAPAEHAPTPGPPS